MRALVLFNPTAGRGKGQLVAGQVLAALRQAGWRVRPLRTRGSGDAEALVQRLAPYAQRAVIIGGDGTLREAAAGFLRADASRLDLGFVPLGNANVVARALGIPLNTEAAVRCAVAGSARSLDVLSASGHVALAMVGIGYDALVTRRLAAARSRPWTRRWYSWNGDSLYAVIGGASLLQWNPPRFQLELDGEALDGRFAAAVISNLETYAKGWAMTPGADPGDGRLDWMARKRVLAPFGALSLACAALHRRAPHFLAEYGQGQRLVLRGERPFDWQADGDSMGTSDELEIRVLPQALTLLVPDPLSGATAAEPVD